MSYHQVWAQVPGRRYSDVRCDECGRTLEPSSLVDVDELGRWNHLVARDALILKLSGGYGAFIDPICERLEVLLCKQCAERLMQEFVSVRRIIQAYMKDDYSELDK